MNNPTIAAISTPMSAGAIGLVRMSGSDAKAIAASVFRPIGKRTIQNVPGFSAIYGHVMDGSEPVDEVVVYVYTAPKSYTGEDVVEFFLPWRPLAALPSAAPPAGSRRCPRSGR